MIRNLLRKSFWLIKLIPGFLLWASFPPMGEKMDCLFALAPLLWFARTGGIDFRRQTHGTVDWPRPPSVAVRSARLWFANGFFFWFATLAWMPAIIKNGGPWPLVVLGWGALSAYCALYFAAFGYLSAQAWGWAKAGGYWRRLVALLVVEPVLWAGLELLRARLFGGFAWNQLGVAPVNAGFGAPAALGGVYLVSALVVLVNGTIASIAERMYRPTAVGLPNWARSIETFLPLLLVWGAFAAAKPFVVQPAAGGDTLRVALIQRNFPSVFERGRDEDPVAVYERLMPVVHRTKPELVVLPESALCEFAALVNSTRAQYFADWLGGEEGAAVLMGGNRRADGRDYNSAGLYTTDPARPLDPMLAVQVYDKVHLVPFGEFIPLDKWIPVLQRFAPVGSCWPGELKLLNAKVPLGVGICYEDTDSAQVRRLAEMGARALCFITNDSWFSRSDEAVQHAWQAVARAIETGLPIVRVGNSGVTGTIAADGTASWLKGPDGRELVDRAATMCDELDLGAATRAPTPYVRLGDKPLFFAFLLILAGVCVRAWRLRRC